MFSSSLKQISLLLSLLLSISVFAQQGKHGTATISSLNTVVNEYTILTADASAGATTIQVNNSALNVNGRFSGPLQPGDLLFIIQLQGASISGVSVPDGNGNFFGMPKDSTWGSITSYNNAGNYEFAEVLAVPGSTSITLSCPLQRDYSQAGKVQVVRVPRYSALTVATGASISCDIWNGVVGGMVIIEVRGNATINGTIQANARGFRGGLTDNSSILGSNDVAFTSPVFGAEKGEGVAGYQNDYNVVGGRYGKGAAANAGGGGTAHNSGGGGGANGGDPAQWRAVGIPSLSTPGWLSAWNIDIPGFTTLNSSGGGRGGYTASGNNASNNLNALVSPPGASGWGGDFRTRQGGYGGRPLDYSGGRLFFGGGGGAGDGNDGFAGAGGRGGGLIFLDVYGQISGSGSITSNGANGANAQGSPSINGIAGNDGAGGGGAGGTIVLKTTQAPSVATISANGGNGGNEDLSRGIFGPNPLYLAEGPGGGGGGGMVLCSFPVTATVLGGANGTTDSDGLNEFPPNGATSGAAGSVNSNLIWFDMNISNQTVCIGGNITLNPTWLGPAVQPVYQWFTQSSGGSAIATGNSFSLTNVTQDTTLFIGACPLTFRFPVTITVSPGVSNAVAGADQTYCVGTHSLSATPPTSGNGSWSVVSGSASINDPTNPASSVTFSNDGVVILEWTISATGCPSSTDQVVFTLDTLPSPALAGADQQICGTTANLNASPASNGILQWNTLTPGVTLISPSSASTQVTNLSPGFNSIELVISNGVCPSDYDTIQIERILPSSPAFAGADQTICGFSAFIDGSDPAPGIGSWTILSGNAQLSSSLTDTSTVEVLNTGSIELIYAISNGPCPSTSDTLSLSFIAAPAPLNAGNDIQICGDSAQVSLTTVPASGTITWLIVSGGGTITNPNAPTTPIVSLQAGTTTLAVENQVAGCPPVIDTLTISSDVVPSAPFAGSDVTICSDALTLSALAPSVGSGQWAGNGAQNFLDASDPQTTVSNLQVGINTLIWSVTNGICPTQTDTLNINVLSIIPPANAGTDITMCNSGTINLNATLPAGLNGSWTDSGGLLAFANPADPISQVAIPGAGTYVLTWTITNGVCPPNSDQVIINAVAPAPKPFAGSDQSSCEDYVTLNATSIGTGFWSILSGNASLESPGTALCGLLGSPGNVVQVVWTMNNGPCPLQYDTLSVTFGTIDFAFAGNDSILFLGDSMRIGTPSPYTSTWEPSAGLSCSNCPNPIASPAQTTTYVLTQTNELGCTGSDTITIQVEVIISFFIPNAFSPNKDGNNDVFRVRALGLENLELFIVDRYGHEVAALKGIDASWDGTHNGKAVNPSVFAYYGTLFFLDGSRVPVQGNVQVMR